MMEWIADYGLFLAKCLTVGVIALVVLMSLSRSQRQQSSDGLLDGYLDVESLSPRFEADADGLRSIVWGDSRWKAESKRRKKQAKAEKQDASVTRPVVYVLQFHGDIQASAVAQLRHEVSAILSVADPDRDEVVLLLESPGGMVPHYGLAASQLSRLRDAKLKLTVCVDKVAASGGYMMACLADEIVAAPFAVVGSIGVVAQVPNVHRLLKKHAIDVEVLTAGEYKRTLTMLGENTPAGREKFQSELEETHDLFKSHVSQWRPTLDMAAVATGEHWYGQQALSLGLVDGLKTSDDLLRERAKSADLFALHWRHKKSLGQRVGEMLTRSGDQLLLRWWERAQRPPNY